MQFTVVQVSGRDYGKHKSLADTYQMFYTHYMTKKNTKVFQKVDFEPNKMMLAIVLLAAVSLTVLTLVAVSSV